MTNLPQRALRRSLFDFPRSIEELFDVFDGRPTGREREGSRSWNPSVDVVETEAAFEVHAELPGVDADKVEVTLDKDTLVIKGERESRTLEEGSTQHRMEIVRGSFERRFTFGIPVADNGVDAQFENGMLTVTVKKAEAALPKRIEIRRS